MAGTSPTKRTLDYLKEKGYTCTITERWNAFAKIRQDLFGFIDIVALGNFSILGIQCTSGDHVAERVAKIKGLKEAVDWKLNTGRILVVGWRKVGARGKRKTWEPRIVELHYKAGWLESKSEEIPKNVTF